MTRRQPGVPGAPRRRECDLDPDFAEIALVGDTEPCICKPAVVRAYQGMMASGSGENDALEVATRVLRYHHPEMPAQRILVTVERWVHGGPLN